MHRLKRGLFFSIVLGVGAYIGTIIFVSDAEKILENVIGPVILGFIFGIFKKD